jgi:thiamine-phosphate pyrophosphorylase
MKIPRFYPILDTRLCKDPVESARVLLEAGARIVQLRHKGPFLRPVYELAIVMAQLAREFGALFIVNDRADIAALTGAGLHLGQDDVPPLEARRIVGEAAVVGFSTHNEAQLRAAESQPVDYLALGPIFPTLSKDNPDPVVGLEGLRRLRGLTNRPLVAIGGITRQNAAQVLEAGADSVAVISDLYGGREPLAQVAREWLSVCQ